MTVDSWQMHIQMLQQMACRCARRCIHFECQCRSRSLRPDHKALGLELDKHGVRGKWIGGLMVRVLTQIARGAGSNPGQSTLFSLYLFVIWLFRRII